MFFALGQDIAAGDTAWFSIWWWAGHLWHGGHCRWTHSPI